MSEIAGRLHKLLDETGVEYEVIHHRTDHTAQQTAWDTHTPPADFAKTVFVSIDGSYAMAVLPANDLVSEEKLRLSLSAGNVRVAGEDETEDLCPGCAIGAAPPFGNLWGLAVYASPSLAGDELITFNAGSHQDAIRMRWVDYARLVEPEVVPLARHD